MMRFNLLLSILFISVYTAFSQDFKWESKTDITNSKGFTEIVLKPEITGKLRSDMGDIRLYDSNNNEVPYIQYSEKPVLYKELFKEYKILEKAHHYDYTRLVIHNPDKSEITNFSLVIKNADVRKWLRLNASDDQKEWFALKDYYYFQSFYNDDNTSEIRVLNFPRSNYEYYELLVYDYFDNPINIIKAGYYDLSVDSGRYVRTEIPVVSQKDTLKQSIIRITFPEQQYIDKLQFEIEGPDFYYRDAQVCLARNSTIKGEAKVNYEQVASMKISSNSDNSIAFSNYPVKEVFLIIDNFDDKPLYIKSATGFQLNHYLTANLDGESTYTLKFGNPKLDPPVYDLKFFADSIPDNLPHITTGSISVINKENSQISDKPFYSSPIFLWIVLGLVALILGMITLKMVKDMKKNE
jgi:hypothetical protein